MGTTKALGSTPDTASYTLAYDHIDKCLIVRCVTDQVGPNQPQQVYTLYITDQEFAEMALVHERAMAHRTLVQADGVPRDKPYLKED
jgi:hypothetical protein